MICRLLDVLTTFVIRSHSADLKDEDDSIKCVRPGSDLNKTA